MVWVSASRMHGWWTHHPLNSRVLSVEDWFKLLNCKVLPGQIRMATASFDLEDVLLWHGYEIFVLKKVFQEFAYDIHAPTLFDQQQIAGVWSSHTWWSETSCWCRIQPYLIKRIMQSWSQKTCWQITHPRKLTWQWKNNHSKMFLPLRFRFSIAMLVFWGVAVSVRWRHPKNGAFSLKPRTWLDWGLSRFF